MFTVKRSEHNPLLSPDRSHPWEAAAAFNGSPVVSGDKTYLLYRAFSEPDRLKDPHIRMSVIGRAVSNDGGDHYGDRRVLISNDAEFDKYGCEDPRVTKIGNKFYIFYTGLGGYPFGPDNIKICLAISKDMKTVEEKHIVTPFNAKAMALFPEKINGKFAALLTRHSDLPPSEICYAEFDKEEDMWSPAYWEKWRENADAHKLHIRRQQSDHLELGAQPVKTKKGWLLIYSHIQKYGSGDTCFGIEAVLLDLKNPRNIIGRTKGAFMVAEEYYENAGLVSHLIFPSGALVRKIKSKEILEVYYGAADTHCCKASISLDNLLKTIIDGGENYVKRFPGNPTILPRPKMDWEVKGTFNPGAIDAGDQVHILYRAVSEQDVSTIGLAVSKDGLSIDERLKQPIYRARTDFESKGCEDPRLMKIDEKIYMTYTAYDGRTPRVAITSISESDFLKRNWKSWSAPLAVTPENVDNKDACIIPTKVNGKYIFLHRVHEHICGYILPSLDFQNISVNECIDFIGPRRGMWDGDKVGIAAPPIKTKEGWLLLYHGVSQSRKYRVGAVLLDPDDPLTILARSAVPLFEPEEEYETNGPIPNVVFPCGLIARGDKAFMYYGGADFVTGVATFSIKEILKRLLD